MSSPMPMLMRRASLVFVVLLALAPLFYVFARTADARRNIVYWDELDTALAFVLKLKSGPSAGEISQQLFALSNEHRMVTSRLLFAANYWLTDTVNFSAIAWIGNLTIVALCVLLIATARDTARRVRLALLLPALLYQLEHYENLLWSGASIDHFQIVLLAAAAIVAVARGTVGGVVVGGVFATLATFTLAHGMVLWPLGAAMLARTRNWRGLAAWGAFGIAAAAGFLVGFELNRAQAFASASTAGAAQVLLYWLALAGSVPALGHTLAAPFLGGVLLAFVGVLTWRGAVRREPVAYPLAWFALGALALIAIGRAGESRGVVFSRYYVLSGTAWAMALYMALNRWSNPRRPWRPLIGLAPTLAAFNVAGNVQFSDEVDSWLECRDRAVLRFVQHGVDGRGVFKLHPAPTRSTALLQEAERAGVYRIGEVCLPRTFSNPKPSARIAYFVDEITVSERSAFVSGWAAMKDVEAKRGDIHLVLRQGEQFHVFKTVTVTRPDVAEATKQPGWTRSGFRFARFRDHLPTGEFEIGFLLTGAGAPEFIMTAHKVLLVGEGKALLATGD